MDTNDDMLIMQLIIAESYNEQLENTTLHNQIQAIENNPVQQAVLYGGLCCHQHRVLA